MEDTSQKCANKTLNNCSEEFFFCFQNILNTCLKKTFKKCWPEYYLPENQNKSNDNTQEQNYLNILNFFK